MAVVGTLFALVNVLTAAVLSTALIMADDAVSTEASWAFTVVAVGLRGQRIHVTDAGLVAFDSVDETLDKFNSNNRSDSREVFDAIEAANGVVASLLLLTVMNVIVTLVNI
jgi:hypothetical protein